MIGVNCSCILERNAQVWSCIVREVLHNVRKQVLVNNIPHLTVIPLGDGYKENICFKMALYMELFVMNPMLNILNIFVFQIYSVLFEFTHSHACVFGLSM